MHNHFHHYHDYGWCLKLFCWFSKSVGRSLLLRIIDSFCLVEQFLILFLIIHESCDFLSFRRLKFVIHFDSLFIPYFQAFFSFCEGCEVDIHLYFEKAGEYDTSTTCIIKYQYQCMCVEGYLSSFLMLGVFLYHGNQLHFLLFVLILLLLFSLYLLLSLLYSLSSCY